MTQTIRVAGIVEESVTDGPGIRLALFCQGCHHDCPGCHNPETHDPEGGREMTVDEITTLYDSDPLLSGITFSGGEPFLQSQPLIAIADHVHVRGGNVIAYSGYTLSQLRKLQKTQPDIGQLLDRVDLLIDGPFILEERSLLIPFRGSANQRIIPLNKGAGKLLADKINCL
jgi:anaerobic ribonucleoside-triphosphate reductase activating protein